jgi:hypothetical protein
MRQPISRPSLANEAIRYIKDDIIIKSNENNLKELIGFNFKYLYTLLKLTNSKNIELCTNRACFANYTNITEAKKHI